jgi:acetylornithine deacetylase/succinyl-diaminopimelate desuccinylase-like protein
MPLCPIETLQRLIRTPSVNPMGRAVTSPHVGEARLTSLLIDLCDEQGWRWSRQPVHPGRDNLLVQIEGRGARGGALLLWDVHQDTVPVEGMSIDPFGGERRDGRVYGRGACDVKGSMAAVLAALSRLTESPPASHPAILLACTVNEECGFTGARELCRTWPCPPYVAIVAEPTDLNVVVAHQGVVRWRCHILGRAAHTSRPDLGTNAVYAMARVVQALERYHDQLSTTSAGHPLCGRPSLCVSTIQGGVGINTVPDRATIEIDHRLPPGESPETAHAAVVAYIDETVELGDCRIEHDPPFMHSRGMVDAVNRPLADSVAALVRDAGRQSELVGVRFGTDAGAIAGTGVPTIVFGPGSIAQAHTVDEFIEIDELELATRLFYRIACEGFEN